MVRITIDGLEQQLPGQWDELTREQLLFLADTMRSPQPMQKVKLHLALKCLGAHMIGVDRRHRYEHSLLLADGTRHHVTTDDMVRLASVFDFLFVEEEARRVGGAPAYRLNPLLTVNPYKRIITPKAHTLLYGPEDGLFDITFEQYIYLNTYLDAVRTDSSMLPQLLAVLWHSQAAFDIERLPHDAELTALLPQEKKTVLVWFLTGCLAQLAEMFPRLFSGTSVAFVGRRNVLDQQLRLLNSLADGDMTRKDAVRRGNIMDALYAMDESVRQKEELEERMAKG